MLINYLKISFRNLWKNRAYTFINLSGMAVGMACCFMLLIYIFHEMDYDSYHPNVDRLYRINYHASFGGTERVLGQIPAPIAPLMRQDFPQIEQIARMYNRSISVRAVGSEQNFEIENAVFTDSSLQAVFGFAYLQGDATAALDRPFSIVLTEETAKKVFGQKDPMGGQLLLANKGPFTVTGVLRDIPENSHLRADLLVPYRNMADVEPDYARPSIEYVTQRNFVASHSATYVLLKEGSDPSEVDAGMKAFMERYGHKNLIKNQDFKLFPVRDIHLRPATEAETSPMVYLRFFAAIGFLILLIACINFINLSTATYLTRTKEVGVRKVLGAGRRSLIGQFMGETLLVSFLAFAIALACVDLFLPVLGNLVDKKLAFSFFGQWQLTALFVGVFLLAGVLAGAYPAFFASRFRPVEIFRDKVGQGSGSSSGWLRKGLITLQFAVAILLISGTLVILSQIDFWRSQPLGFNKEKVVVVPLQSQNMNSLFAPGDSTLRARMDAFEDRLLQSPDVEAVTLGSRMPGLGRVYHPVVTDKITSEDAVFLPANSVDYDYAETFGLEVVAGRDFDKRFGTDHLDAFVINEMAVKELRWDSPEDAIGKKLGYGGKQGKVVGVVKNFATAGLQEAMEPLIMDVSPGTFSTFAIRLSAGVSLEKNGGLPEVLALIEKTWQDFFPAKAFEYSFLDDDLADMYQNESRLASLGGNFAGIAIFLSCFGLFGLISLTVQQRAKEIGIRKVLGASVPGIVGLLSKDFLQLVVLALLIATPVSWYLMNGWLEDFAYRIELSWWHFALAGGAAVLVAFFTMGFQSIKAAMANPVESLRSE
ncbi:MAG TPA: FtsX-like permease family protein [Bacteroidetes bacterium]|nr:FtsX-like permease family protein [Bacteroidota bacterium]